MKRKLIWFILGAAFVIRVISVGTTPQGFNADEASFGYDAYSLLKTGRDQWGKAFPIVLKSFGDYKSPVYSYLAVPTIALFGLTPFAVRLPSVVVGSLSVLSVYLLVTELIKRRKWQNDQFFEYMPLITAGLLAVNPWSVMMSRGAVEANLVCFFLPLGIYFFLKGISQYRYFVWSALFMGLSMFTYHSVKVVIPLVFIGLVFIFRSELKKARLKNLLIPLIIFLLFFGGMLYTFKIGGGSRVSERSITQGALLQGFDERMAAISKGQNPLTAKALHNKYQVIVNRFITNYFQYFTPRFLVQKGVNDASYAMIPGIGVVSVIEFILLFGIVPLLFFEKKSMQLIIVLFFWLMISPLPAALATGGGYSGNRASGMLPELQILETFGFYGWFILLKRWNPSYLKVFGTMFILTFVSGIYGFSTSYFKTHPTSVLKQEGYGNLQVAQWLKDNVNGRTVIVSRSISEPQIFLAFAVRWNPIDFQNSTALWGFDSSKTAWVDQLPEYRLGNYIFKSVDWKTDIYTGSLIVVRADEFTGDQIPVHIFRYPDGTLNIYIIDTNQKIYAKSF